MSRANLSKTHSSISARNVRPFEMKVVGDAAVMALAKLGVHIDPQIVRDQVAILGSLNTSAGDSAFSPATTTASMGTPIQFLQTWLPGFIKVMTAARRIDDLVGIKTVGSWEDAEIVQGIVEPGATATEYGDSIQTNTALAQWNTNFERRSVVRGEIGLSVGLLEESRSASMRLSSAEEKRQACGVALEIFRNAIGFFGWNSGNNRTFGFLNDPNLPAFITAPSASGTGWVGASFQTIINDLRIAIVQLRTQSQDQIDPKKVKLTLALPTNKVDYLSVTTDQGVSVSSWLSETYPNVRVVSAPELTGAGTTNQDCFYLYADDIDSSIDGSSDGGETFVQLVQTKFLTLGVEKRVKSYTEGFSNSTAGLLLKRPWAVVRVTGI